MACSSAPSDGTSSIERFFDGMPPMQELSRKDHLAGCIINKSKASRLTPRNELQAQWLHVRLFNGCFEDESERVPLQDSRFARREQETRSTWMHRLQWLLVGIEHKHL